MTRDELLAALLVERHNGIAWQRENEAHATGAEARRMAALLDVDQAEDDELQAPRRRRLMAADFDRINTREAG